MSLTMTEANPFVVTMSYVFTQ